MTEDPFARFERSRGGVLIPVLLFVAGAVPTFLAVRSIDRLAVLDVAEEPPPGDQTPLPRPVADDSAETKVESPHSTSRNSTAFDTSSNNAGSPNTLATSQSTPTQERNDAESQ